MNVTQLSTYCPILSLIDSLYTLLLSSQDFVTTRDPEGINHYYVFMALQLHQDARQKCQQHWRSHPSGQLERQAASHPSAENVEG